MWGQQGTGPHQTTYTPTPLTKHAKAPKLSTGPHPLRYNTWRPRLEPLVGLCIGGGLRKGKKKPASQDNPAEDTADSAAGQPGLGPAPVRRWSTIPAVNDYTLMGNLGASQIGTLTLKYRGHGSGKPPTPPPPQSPAHVAARGSYQPK
eukprot:scaffold14328_cov143-Isochrysis_galbana.AAC.4